MNPLGFNDADCCRTLDTNSVAGALDCSSPKSLATIASGRKSLLHGMGAHDGM